MAEEMRERESHREESEKGPREVILVGRYLYDYDTKARSGLKRDTPWNFVILLILLR